MEQMTENQHIMQESISALPPQKMAPAREFLRSAFGFYHEHFRNFASLMMPVFVLHIIALFLIFVPYFGEVAYALITILIMVVGFLAGICIILYLIHPEEGTEGLYSKSRKYFFSLVWIALLSSFAIFGGFVLLLIPGIIALIALAFTNYTVLIEGKRGIAALVASWVLTKNYRGQVFKKMFYLGVFLLVVFGIIFILQVGVTFLLTQRVDLGNIGTQNTEGLAVPVALVVHFFTLLSTAAQLFVVTPLAATYLFLVYRGLRGIKGEGELIDTGKARKLLIAYMVVGILTLIFILVAAVLFTAIFFKLFLGSENILPLGAEQIGASLLQSF